MREFKLEPVLRPTAREYFDELPKLHQDDVSRRIEYLAEQPDQDGNWTFDWPEGGPGVRVFSTTSG